MSVMNASPSALSALARDLGAHSQGLRTLGQGGSATGLWRGLAAWEQQACEDQWCAELTHCAPALDQLAEQIARYSATVQALQEQWSRWDARIQGWSAEADRIWALLASADPGTRVALEQRWEELTVSIRSGRQTLSGLDDELDEHAVALGQQIRDSWPAQLVRDGINGYGIYKGTTRGFTGLTQAALGTGILSLAVQLSRAVDVAARSRILSDIRLFSDLARRVGPVARVPLRFVPVASVVSTASTAIPDLIDGNDYEGWRGTTTQVLAGGALVGSVAISIPTPVTVGTGAVVVGAYTAWMGGNAVYDNRAVIMRYGSLGFAWAKQSAAQLAQELPYPDDVQEATGQWLHDNVVSLPDPGEVKVPVSVGLPGIRVPVNVPIPRIPTIDVDDLNLGLPEIQQWGDYLGPMPPIPIPNPMEFDWPPLLPRTNVAPEAVPPTEMMP